uniref:Uncharacterized protein n=1 Tax=Solanum tuberosum TaxID=4113 RepID=M1DWN2_SOLTU
MGKSCGFLDKSTGAKPEKTRNKVKTPYNCLALRTTDREGHGGSSLGPESAGSGSWGQPRPVIKTTACEGLRGLMPEPYGFCPSSTSPPTTRVVFPVP